MRWSYASLNSHPSILALLVLLVAWAIAYCAGWMEFLDRSALLAGIAGYLFGVVGFVALGRRQQPWPTLTQLGVAIALGIAVGLVVHLYTDPAPTPVVSKEMGNKLPNPAPPQFAYQPDHTVAAAPSQAQGGNLLDHIGVIAAVLAVALTVLTLVAQKSASEARAEAERAVEILRDVKLPEIWVRLVLEAQRLREAAQENAGKVPSCEISQPELASLHRRWSELHGAIFSLLVELLHATDAGEANELTSQCERIAIMARELDTEHRGATDHSSIDLLRDQSRRFVFPLRHLLRTAIDRMDEGDTTLLNAERRKNLRKIFRQLDDNLRMLA